VAVPTESIRYREARAGDLPVTFDMSQRSLHDIAARQGLESPGGLPDEAEVRRRWEQRRPLIEFVAAQPGGSFWVCEADGGPVGFVRVARFGEMEELTELIVDPAHQGRGIGRGLLERCWPGPPSPKLGRVVVASGSPADLSLFTDYGVLPTSGHWDLRMRAEQYLERRAQETLDGTEPAVVALGPDRAVEEWKRLEPPAIGHERPLLHEFFARTRSCLAVMDGDQACAVVWVSAEGEIGPGAASSPEHLVPVVLAALDRVAKTHEPDEFGVYCTTDSWWLLRHLRRIGFRVMWPRVLMSSVPLPGMDRYLPTRPPNLL
jgi:GNAT superfamily N-acetyltransferase